MVLCTEDIHLSYVTRDVLIIFISSSFGLKFSPDRLNGANSFRCTLGLQFSNLTVNVTSLYIEFTKLDIL